MYAAAVAGGIWKTTNGGNSWAPLNDFLANIAVTTMAFDPSNPSTIYAGTGDLNFGSFSMGSQGILKSTDAGATWTVKGADVFGPGLPLFQSRIRTIPQASADLCTDRTVRVIRRTTTTVSPVATTNRIACAGKAASCRRRPASSSSRFSAGAASSTCRSDR